MYAHYSGNGSVRTFLDEVRLTQQQKSTILFSPKRNNFCRIAVTPRRVIPFWEVVSYWSEDKLLYVFYLTFPPAPCRMILHKDAR